MNKAADARLLAVLMCAMGIGPLINVGLGATSFLVIEDLGITDGQYGWLSTVCFLLAAAGSAAFGRLTDRISARHQLSVIFGGAAFSMLAAALVPTFLWLLVIYAVSGLAQAMSNPTTNRLAVLHAPKGNREAWIGIKQSGLQASQLFAGLFFPLGAMLLGWRGAVAAAGVVALLLLPWAWRHLPRECAGRASGAGRATKPSSTPDGPGAATLHRRRLTVGADGKLWVYALQICLASIGLTATNVYLPLFAQRELGLSLLFAGLTTAIVGGVGVVARVHWTRRMSAGARTQSLVGVLSLGSVASAACLTVSGESQQVALMWAGVLLHAGMTMGINSVVMAGVMRSVQPTKSGSATGVVALGMYLGIAIAPISMGVLIDATGGFTVGWFFLGCINAAGLFIAVALRFFGRSGCGKGTD